MNKYTFFIPRRLPGMNDIINLARTNKFASRNQKKKYTDLVVDVINLTFRDIKPMGKAWVTLTWIEKNRKRDPDNICAGKKFILDALFRVGMIKNDGWSCVAGFTDTWETDREPGVWVEVRKV